MNRTILLILFAWPIVCRAQGEQVMPMSQLVVEYDWHHYHFFWFEYNHPMVLLANACASKFFNANAQMADSLKSTPEGLKTLYEMRKLARNNGSYTDLPGHAAPLYVFRHQGKPTEVYDGFVSHLCRYSEPEESIDWTLLDSTKMILGYECHMAETDFHGRHWTTWFAPEIPIQAGPWKLCGLPGLILEASDSAGQHSFTATGIEADQRIMTPHPYPRAYRQYPSRKEANRDWRAWQDRLPYGVTDADGTPIVRRYRRDLDFLDADYR